MALYRLVDRLEELTAFCEVREARQVAKRARHGVRYERAFRATARDVLLEKRVDTLRNAASSDPPAPPPLVFAALRAFAGPEGYRTTSLVRPPTVASIMDPARMMEVRLRRIEAAVRGNTTVAPQRLWPASSAEGAAAPRVSRLERFGSTARLARAIVFDGYVPTIAELLRVERRSDCATAAATDCGAASEAIDWTSTERLRAWRAALLRADLEGVRELVLATRAAPAASALPSARRPFALHPAVDYATDAALWRHPLAQSNFTFAAPNPDVFCRARGGKEAKNGADELDNSWACGGSECDGAPEAAATPAPPSASASSSAPANAAPAERSRGARKRAAAGDARESAQSEIDEESADEAAEVNLETIDLPTKVASTGRRRSGLASVRAGGRERVVPTIDTLPDGWTVTTKARATGKSAGTSDRTWVAPNGKKFRSKISALRYVEATAGGGSGSGRFEAAQCPPARISIALRRRSGGGWACVPPACSTASAAAASRVSNGSVAKLEGSVSVNANASFESADSSMDRSIDADTSVEGASVDGSVLDASVGDDDAGALKVEGSSAASSPRDEAMALLLEKEKVRLCAGLPHGWRVISKERKSGQTAGRADFSWISADGGVFRSRVGAIKAIKGGVPEELFNSADRWDPKERYALDVAIGRRAHSAAESPAGPVQSALPRSSLRTPPSQSALLRRPTAMPVESRLAELEVRAMALANGGVEIAAPFVIEWPLEPGTAAFAEAAAKAQAAEARERELERLERLARARRSASYGFNANTALRAAKSVVEHLIRRCEIIDRKERRTARVVRGVMDDMIRKVAFAHKKETYAIAAAAKARAKRARMIAREQQRAERETANALRFAEKQRNSKKRKLDNGAAASGCGAGSGRGRASAYAAPPPSMYHSYDLPSAFDGSAPAMDVDAFIGGFGDFGGSAEGAQVAALEACYSSDAYDAVRYVRSPGGGLSVASGAVAAAAATTAAAAQCAEGEATESDDGEETQSD